MFLTLEDTAKLIKEGKLLHIAADESLLAALPQGNWVGGTTPYFITENGGITCKDKLFVDEFDFAEKWKISVYDKENILSFSKDAYSNGFCVVLVPFASEVAVKYAKESPNTDDLFMTPTLGWITGFDLDAPTPAMVFDGFNLKSYANKAVVLHVAIPDNKAVSIGTVNIFKADKKSTVIEFEEDTLSVKKCLIDGKEMMFTDFLSQNNIDTKLPLVADYNGILINASIKAIIDESKTVELYAPVFSGVKYSFAEPVTDYSDSFAKKLTKEANPFFSCNCILNYLYGDLQGKATPPFAGPVTFGEIAYQLLNQTLVFAEIV